MSIKLNRLTGLTGGSVVECALITAVCPAGEALRRALTAVGAPHGGLGGGLLDVLLLGLLPLAAVLVPEHCVEVLCTAACGTVLCLASRRRGSGARRPRRRVEAADVSSAVTAFRSSVLLGTCAAILAVDFSLFPLRLAKTHSHGTGLMDLGSGAFIFAHGLVSRDARSFTAEHRGARRRLGHALKGSLPLMMIGLGRLVSTTASGYEVPIDEYGAHWNFFFTIAAVRSLAALVPQPSNALHATAACVLAAALHEAWLRTGGGAAWLDSSVRGADLVSQNREGIVSMPGYLTIHLAGVAFGKWIYSAPIKKSAATRAASASLVAWLAWRVITHVAGPASRRAADAAYGAWVTAHCSSLVASHAAVDSTFASVDTARQQPAFISVIGAKHVMLVTFLAANVMTGVVNLSIDTLATPERMALVALVAYQTAVCCVAMTAYRLLAAPKARSKGR